MLHRTVTGRTASADPNGQNFPKRGPLAKAYRKIFVARPGYTYVECDLSQAELRIAAWMAQEPTMLKIYQDNGDIHMATAVIVSGLTQEAFNKLSEETRKEYRQKAKAVSRLSEEVRPMNGKFCEGPAHPKWADKSQRLKKLRGMSLGTLQIVGDTIKMAGRSRQLVEVRCSACEKIFDAHVDNLLAQKTKSCRCQRGRKYSDPRSDLIGKRYDAIKQRCENFDNPSYRNYGDIGIQCRFSRKKFIDYILETFPDEDYKNLDIDRIDNDGHYEVGNLRLVDRASNLRNKSTNKYVEYCGRSLVAADLWTALKADYPNFGLSRGTTAKLAAQGVAWGEILERRPRRRRSSCRAPISNEI